MEKEKVLVYEDTVTIDRCKQLTQKTVDIINKSLKVFNKWGFECFTVDEFKEISVGNINPEDHVLNQIVLSATGLQKLKIKPEAIKNMINLPDEYNEFAKAIEELKEFVRYQSRIVKDSHICFNAIVLTNGIATIDNSAFEKEMDVYRIYENNEVHANLTKVGNLIAEKFTEFQNILKEIGEIPKSGFSSRLLIEERYFSYDGEKFHLKHKGLEDLTKLIKN